LTETLEFDLGKQNTLADARILLDSGPPRALYKVNPRLIFGKTWWDEVRQWAYKKYNNTCAACGRPRCRLEAHEMYSIDYKKGKLVVKAIVPLCSDCHSFIHQDLHKSLLSQGLLKFSDVQRILKHGKAVLKRAGVRCIRKDPNVSKIKPEDWRLVLNGTEYAPIPKEK
jgi:hypothetical protein